MRTERKLAFFVYEKGGFSLPYIEVPLWIFIWVAHQLRDYLIRLCACCEGRDYMILSPFFLHFSFFILAFGGQMFLTRLFVNTKSTTNPNPRAEGIGSEPSGPPENPSSSNPFYNFTTRRWPVRWSPVSHFHAQTSIGPELWCRRDPLKPKATRRSRCCGDHGFLGTQISLQWPQIHAQKAFAWSLRGAFGSQFLPTMYKLLWNPNGAKHSLMQKC